jgi:hypothetical protein
VLNVGEYSFCGWNGAAEKQLKELEDKGKIKVLSKKITRKKIPILKGDSGEQAIYSVISIEFEGELW